MFIRAFTLLPVVLLFTAVSFASEGDAEAPLFETDAERFSYVIGVFSAMGIERNLGSVAGMELVFDKDVILKGFTDGLKGTPAIDQQELQLAMRELQQKMSEMMQEKNRIANAAQTRAGNEFLAANKTKPGVVALPSGLQYQVLEAGTGASPSSPAARVKVNYRGTLINGTQFDSSYDRGEPSTFGLSNVIRGWTEGVQLMKEGGKWRFFIPPQLAYGERATGTIPGNSTLIFDVELLEVLE